MPTPIPEDEGNLGENMSGLHMAGPIRRCKSEDAGYKHRTSTPRVTIKPSYPVSNDDIKTPLLMVNEEDDDFESNNHPLSRGSDETDDGTKSPTRSKTLSRRRRYGLRIVKYVVFALVIIGMIVSLVHTLIFCTRKDNHTKRTADVNGYYKTKGVQFKTQSKVNKLYTKSIIQKIRNRGIRNQDKTGTKANKQKPPPYEKKRTPDMKVRPGAQEE
ncbi:hypothetical protein FSP39_013448 [Pinctada imbricata]|uniref:Uncharacterized protein n=1 Tax=Pinctada imbricata TaxID=66713 RepID=A0AA89C5C4_PINIB|nr:hypothetical protein FSP39_013448 [Pinctada imbricata]